jgi:hypothetical protein
VQKFTTVTPYFLRLSSDRFLRSATGVRRRRFSPTETRGLELPPGQVPLQPRVSSPTLGVVEAIPDLRAPKAICWLS